MWHFVITGVISVRASVQLLVRAEEELKAKAAIASESHHVALYTPLCSHTTISFSMCVSVHYSPFPLSLPFPSAASSSPALFFFSGCSKLERGPGFSALSESSVSDDTASSCSGLSEEGMGWGGLSALPLLARLG